MKNPIRSLILFLALGATLSAFAWEIESSREIPVEEVLLTLTAAKITNLEPPKSEVGIPRLAVVHRPQIALSKPVNLSGVDVSRIKLADDWATRAYVCRAMGFKDVYYLWGFSNYDEQEGYFYALPDQSAKLALDYTSSSKKRLIDRVTCLR